MVADGHRVMAQRIHEFGGDGPLVIGIKQRPLKLVAPVHQQRMRRPRPGFSHGGDQPGHAAETIAGEIGRDEFIEAMNAKARQLGMTHTIFADPSGLSADNISSIGDLYRLTKYIYENRSFIFEITANKELSSAYVGGDFDGLINFNEVEDMDNFVGGKVGETLAAHQTSISLHTLRFQGDERTLAVILLGSDERAEDIKTLISYVQNRFDR